MVKETIIFNEKTNKNFTVLIGQNDKENWKIIDDSSQKDLWFHVSSLPSSHVILKTNNIDEKDIGKQTLIHCAFLCKSNSKYSNHKKISIIYTSVKNLKKGDKPGSVTATSTKIIVI